MTQLEAANILRKDMDLSEEVDIKSNQISAFLDQANTFLEECNYLITSCVDYLSKPDDGGKNAPIPAWRGAAPNQHEARRAFDVLRELIVEAKPFLLDTGVLREKHTACVKEQITYYEKVTKLAVKINPQIPDASIELDIATIKYIAKNMGKMPALMLQVNSIVETISVYEQRMKSIKNKMNMLKSVN